MNMKEVQLLGILAVVAGGIIVLSLWGSQPETQTQNEESADKATAGRVATGGNSGQDKMEDWEWLTREESPGTNDNTSSDLNSSAGTSSNTEQEAGRTRRAQTQKGNTTTANGSGDDVTARIENSDPADIGLEQDKEEKEEQEKASPRIHEVKKGQTFSAISRQHYGTTSKWRKIFKANRDVVSSPKKLRPGMELVIPGTSDSQSVARKDGDEKPLLSAQEGEEGKKYTVKKGDTLWSLANDHYDNPNKRHRIIQANDNVEGPQDLRAGMTIIIPE